MLRCSIKTHGLHGLFSLKVNLSFQISCTRCKFTVVVVCPYGNVCKTHVPQPRAGKQEMHYPVEKPFFTFAGLTILKEIIYCGNFNKERSRFIYRTMHNNFTAPCKFTVSWVPESVRFCLDTSVRQIIDKFQHHKAFHLSHQDKPSKVYNNTDY